MTKNVKKYLIMGVIAILLAVSIFFFMNSGNSEKDVLNKTYSLSTEYLSLRYRTDNILLEAKSYSDYKNWNTDLNNLIEDWEYFENNVKDLEELGTKLSELKELNFNLIENAYAYNKEEITRVFDKAPAGKKIATLAKHLGVDAKKAYAILKQDQAQVTVDAWNEAGDTFSKLETSAVVIKDSCKVAGFVGGIVLTGGTAGLATATTLTKATVVITGADLVLEVTDDVANIAFGDNNGVSAIARDIRTVTEPVANILSINKIDSKIDAVLLGVEKFRETVQEGNILGIQLIPGKKFKVDTSLISKYKEPIYISELTSEEVDTWLEEQEIEYKNPTREEIEKILRIKKEEVLEENNKENKEENKKENNNKQNNNEQNNNENQNISLIGIWEGIIKWTPSESKPEEQASFILEFLPNGKIESPSVSDGIGFNVWEEEGNVVRVYPKQKEDGYYEFKKEGNEMIFIKLAGPDSEGKWSITYAGSDFFGGKFQTITLYKQ